MKCIVCATNTSNPKFCSRSCSAKNNNSKSPKRKRTKACKTCTNLILSDRLFCKHCLPLGEDLTLSEAIYTKHHKSSAFALVRSRARAVYSKRNCEKCGYDKHTEVCHRKPIASFPMSTKISVVNATSNLIRLCPNCHWEHDNL